MKNSAVKRIIGTAAVILISAVTLGGCGQEGESGDTGIFSTGTLDSGVDSGAGTGADTELNDEAGLNTETELNAGTVPNAETDDDAGSQSASGVTELEVRFGDDGEPFTMHLEENETAAAIARYVGTSDWRLPIYERDDDADYDVMQYYDVSSRYDIPSNPETVTSEKAGDVYYSDPNRIVLFYHDAEITGEYTKIGTFEATDTFVAAVEENPVLEGWGNKIVQIARP